MKLKNTAILFFLIFISYQTYSQRHYSGQNYIGLTGGLTIFDIQTDDFVTKSKGGFMGGFAARGAFHNDFDLIYGITFQNANIAVEGQPSFGSGTEEIEYTIQGAQINILGSYNIVVDHLSIEFGPVFNLNGKMKLKDDEYEDYILKGHTTTTAKDIQEISQFDFRVLGGITAGMRHFRLTAQYHYGVTNILGKLNDQGLEKSDFKGNTSTIVVAAIVYF